MACEQCGIGHAAPPEIRVCERCRYRNVSELRALYAAAAAIAHVNLKALAGRVVYPFRPPMSPLDAARLARAALELQAAALELADLAELRAATRKGPKRAAAAAGKVKRWKRGSGKP